MRDKVATGLLTPQPQRRAIKSIRRLTAMTWLNRSMLREMFNLDLVRSLEPCSKMTTDNGIQDAGEVGIEGVTVRLTGTDDFGNPVDITVQTDAAGNYTFENLNPGTFTVTQTQPAGFNDGNDNGAPGSTVGNDQISNITVGAGEAVTGNTFGETLALDAPLNEGTAGFPPNLPSFATFRQLCRLVTA